MNRILTLIFAVALLAGNASADNAGGLHWAATHNDTDTIRLLLDSGEDVNQRNKYGLTPLHKAAFLGQTDAVKMLLANGADIAAKDKQGQTPLKYATSTFNYTNKETVQLLIKAANQAKTTPNAAVAKNKCRQALDGAGVSIKTALTYMKTAESVTMDMLESALNSADSGIIAAKLHCK